MPLPPKPTLPAATAPRPLAEMPAITPAAPTRLPERAGQVCVQHAQHGQRVRRQRGVAEAAPGLLGAGAQQVEVVARLAGLGAAVEGLEGRGRRRRRGRMGRGAGLLGRRADGHAGGRGRVVVGVAAADVVVSSAVPWAGSASRSGGGWTPGKRFLGVGGGKDVGRGFDGERSKFLSIGIDAVAVVGVVLVLHSRQHLDQVRWMYVLQSSAGKEISRPFGGEEVRSQFSDEVEAW